MTGLLNAEEFLEMAETKPVIDVRSPKEFHCGHIPGAFNIPLFSDEERAVVGTIYKHSGQESAIMKARGIAEPKQHTYLEELRGLKTGPEILVHCWRGGMRSENMAALFADHGFSPSLLRGGYKAYRKHVREKLGIPAVVIVVGGYTGSGKTRILQEIFSLGEQVLDLEAIAHHKGSVFGGLGQLSQPTNEQFENDLYRIFSRFDLNQPVWIEDESRMIGSVTLPDPVISKISNGILIRILCDRETRIRRLVGEYSFFDPDLLSAAILKISERLGGTRTRDALESIRSGHFSVAASLVLDYYDKAYDHAIERRPNRPGYGYMLKEQDPAADAEGVVQFSKELLEHGTHLS